MAKSSKNTSNKKKIGSKGASPHANAPTQRTPNGPNPRTRVSEAFSTDVRQLVNSGSKALTRR